SRASSIASSLPINGTAAVRTCRRATAIAARSKSYFADCDISSKDIMLSCSPKLAAESRSAAAHQSPTATPALLATLRAATRVPHEEPKTPDACRHLLGPVPATNVPRSHGALLHHLPGACLAKNRPR